MNFLAHLYLSGSDPEVMIGNFIGDFVKGRDLSGPFGPGIARGVEMHRSIDEFTDHHPIVKRSKNRLWPVYRHYSGVIVDIFYDHFLAAGWTRYSNEPLAQYASKAYGLISERASLLPARVTQMLPYMIRGNWLVNYASTEGIHRALSGMARRTSFESKMELAINDLERDYEEYQNEFDNFFPELIQHSTRWLTQPAKANQNLNS